MLLLTACANGNRMILDTADGVCGALETPIDGLLDTIVGRGSQIIGIGAGDVVVKADDLAVAYDNNCQ